jgi:hypothetical protein
MRVSRKVFSATVVKKSVMMISIVWVQVFCVPVTSEFAGSMQKASRPDSQLALMGLERKVGSVSTLPAVLAGYGQDLETLAAFFTFAFTTNERIRPDIPGGDGCNREGVHGVLVRKF